MSLRGRLSTGGHVYAAFPDEFRRRSGPHAAGVDLSGLVGLAGREAAGAGGVEALRNAWNAPILWPLRPTAPGGDFGAFEHRRRE